MLESILKLAKVDLDCDQSRVVLRNLTTRVGETARFERFYETFHQFFGQKSKACGRFIELLLEFTIKTFINVLIRIHIQKIYETELNLKYKKM